MNFELQKIKQNPLFKDCNFSERATSFPFSKRWICDHCKTEIIYQPHTIKESMEIFNNYRQHDGEF